MSNDSADHDLIDEIADEIVSRYQAGQTPTIEEYCRQYPELETELHELFPLLMMLQSAKADTTADHAPYPERIGGYRILGELGRGGMGIVYEAEQEALGRRVALKVLTPRLTQKQQAKIRFEREARAIASLHHTNIVPVFGIGREQDSLYIAMQYIDGVGLDKLIEHTKQNVDELLSF
ncbi:MAG: protein kinase, partial [Pirellulales bacterium]|nr:protein kinase [Pirellulales bacterium]